MLLALFFMSLGKPDQGPQRVIARCAGTAVKYGDIAISVDMVAHLSPKGHPSGLSNEEVRDAVEQQRLDRIIASLALRFAARHYGMHIKEEEVMASLPAHARDEAAYRRSFEPDLAVPRAARRVILGEDKDAVFDQMLSGFPGITRATFDQALILFSSVEVIDEFLSKDQAMLTRARLIEDARDVLVIHRLQDIAAERARASHQTIDDAKAALWQEILESSKAEAVDGRFRLPSWKGIL